VVDPKASLFSALRYILEHWSLRDGPNPTTEVAVLLATHGWWPWLLTLFILILIACVIAYFVRQRRASA
jgi:hypothetical protein